MIKDYKKFIFCFFLITFSFKVLGSEIKILYKINENIITSYDVENESNYLKTLNKNLAKLPKKELMETAIRSLIREKIKKDEIDRVFEINYEQAMKSNNIKNVIKSIYTNLNFETEKDFFDYLEKNNVTEKNLKQKFILEQMWNQLIVNKYNSSIKINENQINQKVDEIISNNNDVVNFNLSEIVFLEKNKKDNEEKYLEIKKSINRIGFDETAILYSISESAKLGGKIGWIYENQISKKIVDKINEINIGEYTQIINTAGGNIILKLNDKKKEKIEINRQEEIAKLIKAKKNQLFTEYSIIFYKELENKAYVEKL